MKKWWERMIVFDKDAAGGGNDKDGKGDLSKGKGKDKPAAEPAALDWETWHGALPKEAQALVADHERGLKTALGTERDARGEAEKSLRDVAGKLEEGSEAQKEVLKLADEVSTKTTKTEFYEDAHEAGIINLKLAYHIAITEELIDKRGNVDFENMKENYPELFTKIPRKPKGGAGEGAGDELGQTADMNTFIRKSAGRQN